MLRFLASKDHAVIFPFINNWITRNSILTIKCLTTYIISNSMGFQHYRINKFGHLVTSDGTNTNEIEETFSSVKRTTRSYN